MVHLIEGCSGISEGLMWYYEGRGEIVLLRKGCSGTIKILV